LERRPDKSTEEDKKLPPVLLLLDEFPRLGKIDAIRGALATLRSKGVTICLMVQSLAQLDEIYGRDARRTILDNCPYKAILNVTDADSQKYFSDLSGSSEVEKKGYNVSYDPDSGLEVGTSDNYSLRREPIIYPHEFAKLHDIVLMTPRGFCRVDKAPYYERKTAKNDEKIVKSPVERKPPPTKVTDVTDPIVDTTRKVVQRASIPMGKPIREPAIRRIKSKPSGFDVFALKRGITYFRSDFDADVYKSIVETREAIKNTYRHIYKWAGCAFRDGDGNVAKTFHIAERKLFKLMICYKINYHFDFGDSKEVILTELNLVKEAFLIIDENSGKSTKMRAIRYANQHLDNVIDVFDILAGVAKIRYSE
jgi:hypothetical protein